MPRCEIQIANRDGVPAVPTAALRADTDVPLTAAMLGIDEADAAQGDLAREAGRRARRGKNVVSLGGREIELPAGVDAARSRR